MPLQLFRRLLQRSMASDIISISDVPETLPPLEQHPQEVANENRTQETDSISLQAQNPPFTEDETIQIPITEYRNLSSELQYLRFTKLQGDEKSRRHQELVEEVRQETSSMLEQKDQQIASLTKQLNTLQFRPDLLDDEEAIRIMKQLHQQLDRWVKANFRDTVRLQDLTKRALSSGWKIGELQNQHQQWGFIHAVVCFHVFRDIFKPYMLGIVDEKTENMLYSLEAKVIHHCPSHVAEHWHSATHIAVASLSEQTLEDICNNCVRIIDSQLSLYATADLEARTTKLYTFLQKCVNFKQRLDRQTSRYKFSHIRPGSSYRPWRMESVTGEDTPGATIWFCLWPGLWKDNMLIQPETVWTSIGD